MFMFDLSHKWQARSYSTTDALAIFFLRSVPDLKEKLQQELCRLKAGRGCGRPGGTGKAGLKVGPFRPGVVKTGLLGPSRVTLRNLQLDELTRKQHTHRYMHAKVTERSKALDDRIDEFAELVQKYYSVDELTDPNTATEDTTTVVGRIVHDADVSGPGTKLNESSIALESSRTMGPGVRVPLRFTPKTTFRGGIKGVGGMSFFPGAIVALRGRNSGGGFFLVEEILSLPPLEMPLSPPVEADAFSVCIACGPFSSDSDLEYKPWTNLLDKLKEKQLDVLLLIGPFVDAANTPIKDGNMDETPKELFDRQFTERLEIYLSQAPWSMVVLVPSVNDLISHHAVFPQCELDPKFSRDSRVRLHPNPTRFTVNGVSFAATSVDTLFHLRKEEFFRRTPEVDPLILTSEPATDSMSNLVRNIFQQRSFYPIFPAPLDVAREVNLDVTQQANLALNSDESVPDVLVLPSRLKQFSKVVDGTLVVNPSFVSRGSYAVLTYAGQSLTKDRMRVDISRI